MLRDKIVIPENVVYKIIPDRSVENKKSHDFARDIHDIYRSPLKRVQEARLGGAFYKTKERFWYFIRMTATEISFHFACSESSTTYATQKIDRLWPKATVERCENALVSPENTLVCEMKYRRHNIFSLDADWREDTVPIASILNVSKDMKEGDMAGIWICIDPVNRMNWADVAEKAHEQFRKGKTPKRNSISGRFTLMNLGRSIDAVMHEVSNLVDLATESETKKKKNTPDLEKREILIDGHPLPMTRSKRHSPTFKTFIRCVSHSPDKDRREITLRALSNAFNELAGDNELVRQEIHKSIQPKLIEEINTLRLSPISLMDFDANIMSADEVGKLIQLPTASLQDQYREKMSSTQVTEVEIPKCFLDPSGIYVGTSTSRGKSFDIHIPTKSLDTTMTARGFLGSPRQGKDQALINLIVESKRKHGIGAIIPDWIDEHAKDKDGHHRGLSDAVRDSLSPDDVIDIDFSNYDWPVYFGLHSVVRSVKNSRIAADRVSKEITSFLMGEDIDHHTTREYLRDAAKVCGGDWLDIKRLFVDEEFRAKKIHEMENTNIGDADMWRSFSDDMSEAQRAQIFAPVNVRMGEILNDEVLKPIFCQRPNPLVDLEKWISEGKVVILRMKVDELAMKTLAHFVVMASFLIKLSLGGKGAPTWLVLNEPHQVQTPSLVHFIKRILVEGPKYRIAPLLAFHHLGAGHLSREFVDTLSSANISWHLFFNSNVQTYEKLKTYIEPTFTPETAMKQTAQFHFVAAGWRDTLGMMQSAFMCAAPARVKDRWGAHDNSFLTKQHARTYGKRINDVLTDFRKRNRSAKALQPNEANEVAAGSEESVEPKKKSTAPEHVFQQNRRKSRR